LNGVGASFSAAAKIATVIWAHIGKAAQATGGDTVRFSRYGIEEAHRLYRQVPEKLVRLAQVLA